MYNKNKSVPVNFLHLCHLAFCKRIFLVFFCLFMPLQAYASTCPAPSTVDSLIPNGDFNKNYVDASDQGIPYTGSENSNDFAPPPWSKYLSADLSTDDQINFDDVDSVNHSPLRSSLPGFNSSPVGGSFMGFRRNEGIFNTLSVVDASQEITIFFYYTEYEDPDMISGSPDLNPTNDINIIFRINATSNDTGTLISSVDNLHTTGGTEGTWETRTITFVPANFGIANNSNVNFYLGAKDSREFTWVFVDGLVVGQTAVICPAIDYGDAPASFGNTSAIVNTNVYLGATAPDSESGPQSDYRALSDGPEEDGAPQSQPGVNLFPVLVETASSYSTPVSVNNTSGDTATLEGWIDFDYSGTFDADEKTSLTGIANGTSGNVTLNWPSIPSDIENGTTYIRLRLTNDTTGAGEVEDHVIGIAFAVPPESPGVSVISGQTVQSCQAIVFQDDFDDLNADDYLGPNNAWSTTIRDWTVTGGGEETYARVKSLGGSDKAIYLGNGAVRRVSPALSSGLSFDADGRLTTTINAMELRSGPDDTTPGVTDVQDSSWGPDAVAFFRAFPTTVGKTYRLYFTAVPESDGFWGDGIMRVDTPAGSAHFRAPSSTGGEINYAIEFTATSGSSTISLVNYGHIADSQDGWCDPQNSSDPASAAWCTQGGPTASNNATNELIFDDVSLVEAACNSDYSDAPASYGTALHNIVSGVYLGTGDPDAEASSLANANASGDDLFGVNDDDGITIPTLIQGNSATINAQATHSGGYLQGWIDWNGDGDFTDANEQVASDLQLSSGTSGTINIPVTVPASAIVGQTFARFRWSTTAALGSTGAASDGEVEDYVLTIAAAPIYSCTTKADIWYANDESASISADEFLQARDFIYQVSDSFYHSSADGVQSGLIGWGASTVNVLIPVTDTFNDLGDSGLTSTSINTDSDDQGVREKYTFMSANNVSTDLNLATQRLTNLINAGNGRRTGVPQVAVILTDAIKEQLDGTIAGGGEPWVTSAASLRAAGPDGVNIAVVLLDEAATAYDTDPTSKSIVDRVVGPNGIVIKTSSYAAVADKANGYIDQTVTNICSIMEFPTGVDYGDAPVSGTAPNGSDTNAYGEASHAIVSGIYLGAGEPDAENSSLYNSNASGDDLFGIDDDDGVTIPTLTKGKSATFTVDVNGSSGNLQGWVDWNGDGDFADAGEQIATDERLISGSTGTLSISTLVPADAIVGQTFVRFRWSTTAGLGINTPASDGEVEDYVITITAAPSSTPTPSYSDFCTADNTGNTANVQNELHRVWPDHVNENFFSNTQKASELGKSYNTFDMSITGMSKNFALSDARFTVVNMAYWDQVHSDSDPTVSSYFTYIESGGYWESTAGDGTPVYIYPLSAAVDGVSVPLELFANDDALSKPNKIFAQAIPGKFSHVFTDGGTGITYSHSDNMPLPKYLPSVDLGAFSTSDNKDLLMTFALEYADGRDAFSGHPDTGTDDEDFHGYVNGWRSAAGYDYGDADGYAVAGHGADTCNGSLYIGDTRPDTEEAPQSDGAGTVSGDANEYIDDESGLTLDAIVSNETSYTVTIPYYNNTGANATLAAWIDFDNNGLFEAGERQSTTVSTSDNSAVLSWSGISVNASASTLVARFRIASDAAELADADGLASNGEVEDYAISVTTFILNQDYGDAPTSGINPNGSGTNNYGEASHKITSGIYLGYNTPDAEATNQPTADADGDDLDGNRDEDGMTIPPLIQGVSTTINARVTGSGYLQGWVDWNGDGDFADTDEQIVSDLRWNSAGTGTLNIPVTVPATTIYGQTFARFRWSSIAGLNSTGAASDGEVEDYAIVIATENSRETACNALGASSSDTPDGVSDLNFPLGYWAASYFEGHSGIFGVFSAQNGSGGSGSSLFRGEAFWGIGQNPVVIQANGSGPQNRWLETETPTSPTPPPGYVGDTWDSSGNAFYEINFRREIEWPAMLRFGYDADDVLDDTIEVYINGKQAFAHWPTNVSTIPPPGFRPGEGKGVSIPIDAGDQVWIRYINLGNIGGFSFNFDVIGIDCDVNKDYGDDYGDAPVSGKAPNGSGTNAYGEASHTITSGIFMGDDLPDAETANQPTTNAAGDDQDDNDDEDGINIPPLTQGTSTTLSAKVTGSGYLQGWIDWNGDGDFADAGERVANNLQLSSGTSGTINIPVAVPATAINGETIARFRWSTTSGLNSTGAASDGEVEDYELTISTKTTTTCPAVFNPVAINFSGKTFTGTDSHVVPNVAIINGKSVDMLLSLVDTKGSPPLKSEEEGSQWDYPGSINGPGMVMQVKPDDALSGTYRVAFVNSGTVDPVEFDFEIALTGLTSDDGGGDLVISNVSHHFPGLNPNAQASIDIDNNTLTISTRGGTPYANESSDSARIAVFDDVSTFDIEFTRINTNPLAYLTVSPSMEAVTVGSACTAMNNDYGDAPVSGPSPNGSGTNSYGEASHNIVSGIFMGVEPPDLDSSYQSGTAAEGDDLDGNDDEDGITFPFLRQSVDGIITAQVTGAGYLQGWIDWNGDGDFTDAGEHVANNLQLASGTSGTINVPVIAPVTAIAGQTFARFRWSTTPGLGSTGAAGNGEVEDYEITIDALPLFGCKAEVDLWYANDESGSIDALEYQQSLDFIYQVTDSFYHSATDGAKSGIISWGNNTIDIIIPATDTLNDLSDYGLNSTTIVTDGDGRGIREKYNTRLADGINTNLVLATQRLGDLISAGNGRRVGLPQVAVILTDASMGQLSSSSTGGEPWVTAANALRAAVPEGIRIAVVLLDDAATAYDVDPTTKSVVDRVVGTTGLVIQTSNYADVANQANGYITQVVDDLCSIATNTAASSISGRVFEDQSYGGGSGSSFGAAGTIGISGAIIELYDVNGNRVGATQSGTGGYYILPRLPDGNYFVRVVNGTVNSGRAGSDGNEVPVMTYRSVGTNVVSNEIGGRYPERADAWINNDDSILNTSTFLFNSGSLDKLPAQSIQAITIFGSSVTNTNFGFNFNTVINTNEAGQGSLQQFVLNNNILSSTGITQNLPAVVNSDYQSGDAVAVFMIPNTSLSAGEAIIKLTTELRIEQPGMVIDGRVQAANIGTGSVVLIGNDKAFNDGIFLTENAGNSVLRDITITDFDGSGIVIHGTGRNHSNGVSLNQLIISNNGGYGVLLENGAVNNQLIANQIWENNWAGIASDADPVNTFSSNSLHENNGIGIDLGLNGVTANSDSDTWLNYPEVSAGSTISSNGSQVVAYDFDIDVPANTYGYRIEFFSNTETDPSGHGEGETYLGYVDIQSAGNGLQNFKGSLNANQTVPATASIAVTLLERTGAYSLGSTSEFSGVRNRNLSVCTDVLSNPNEPIPLVTIDENSTNVTYLEAQDVNGNPITYAISGGADGDKFVINAPQPGATFDCLSIEFIKDDGIISTKRLSAAATSVLRNGPPPPGDYEAPTDSGQDNTYDVVITATDADGNTVTKPVTVTVQNVNEKPRLTVPPSVSYPELEQTVVIDLDAYDPDAGDAEGEGMRYRISGGADAAQFNLDPMTGELRFNTPPDYSYPTDQNADNQYDVTVRVMDSQGYSSSQTLLIVVTDDPENNGINLSVKALLQGAFEASSGLMTDHLRSKGILPLLQPYSNAPFNYSGAEQINLDLALIEGNDAMVDWVLLELLSADTQQLVAAKAVLIQRDGDLMDAETGTAQLFFPAMEAGEYYLSLRHRNHLGVLTASPQALAGNTVNQIDFSNPTTTTRGEFNRMQLAANDGGEDLALLWSGDINHDNRLILSGTGNDLTQVLSKVLMAPENTAFNSSYQAGGYYDTDLNLDGVTLFTGPGNDSNILLGNILIHPANTAYAGNFIANGGLAQ